jgi:uncharacterized protein (DUF927 family)
MHNQVPGQDVKEKAHPSVQAVINRFALAAAAARMVITAGLLPWTVAETDAGIIACMARWVAQRGNIDTAGELLRAGTRVLATISAALPDRFISVRKEKRHWVPASAADKIRQKTPELFDGYVKPDRVLIRPEAWRRLCNGHDPAEMAKHLQQQGALIADYNGGKLARPEQVIGKVERFYVLSRASLTP